MGRPKRVTTGDLIYHALNRANAGIELFRHDGDFAAFEDTLTEAFGQTPMRILVYTLMPNHWHFVLWPHNDGDLSDFLQWATLTHTQRWHAHRGNVGSGHIYQGRFKSIVVQEDSHLLTVCRYVERNPVAANLVARAEDWRWSSLWRRCHPKVVTGPPLADWPFPIPSNYTELMNTPLTAAELASVRKSMQRGIPFGSAEWTGVMARRFGIPLEPKPRGRPPKK